MYKISVKSETREATFEKDNEKKIFRRTYSKTLARSKDSDVLKVEITRDDNSDQLNETWIVLHGDKSAIFHDMRDTVPLAQLENDTIFEYLRKHDLEEVLTIVYPLYLPSPFIQQSFMHQELREAQNPIIASMFGYPVKEIYTFKPTYNPRAKKPKVVPEPEAEDTGKDSAEEVKLPDVEDSDIDTEGNIDTEEAGVGDKVTETEEN